MIINKILIFLLLAISLNAQNVVYKLNYISIYVEDKMNVGETAYSINIALDKLMSEYNYQYVVINYGECNFCMTSEDMLQYYRFDKTKRSILIVQKLYEQLKKG